MSYERLSHSLSLLSSPYHSPFISFSLSISFSFSLSMPLSLIRSLSLSLSLSFYFSRYPNSFLLSLLSLFLSLWHTSTHNKRSIIWTQLGAFNSTIQSIRAPLCMKWYHCRLCCLQAILLFMCPFNGLCTLSKWQIFFFSVCFFSVCFLIGFVRIFFKLGKRFVGIRMPAQKHSKSCPILDDCHLSETRQIFLELRQKIPFNKYSSKKWFSYLSLLVSFV
jgi:hypothetical protein